MDARECGEEGEHDGQARSPRSAFNLGSRLRQNTFAPSNTISSFLNSLPPAPRRLLLIQPAARMSQK